MTIDELNKLLSEKKPSGICTAKINDCDETTFTDVFGDQIISLLNLHRWQFSSIISKEINDDFFRVVAPYVDTPVNERKPEKKYNIILFEDINPDDIQFLTMIEKDNSGRALRTNEECKIRDKGNPDYQFTKAEINDIIERRPKYENVIKAAMTEVED